MVRKSDIANITFKGDKELQKALRKLPRAIHNKILNKATRAGAKIALVDAQRNVPVDTGRLERSLTVRAISKDDKGKRKNVTGHKVMADKKKAGGESVYYSSFVEFGTKKWEGDEFLRPAIYSYDQQAKIQVEMFKVARANLAAAVRQARGR